MLAFLRKIRKSLIGIGSTRKYLYYAIGEILLVMIGILLALQVNNWNSNRKKAVTRQLYLKSIIAQLDENIRYTNNHIGLCDDRIATLDKVFSELNQPIIDYDSLIESLQQAETGVGTSNLKTLAVEELLVSNNIAIFEKELRDKILRYHSFLLWLNGNINTNLDEARKYQLSFFQSTDMAFEEGFKKNENLLVKDWKLNPDSEQLLHATNFFTYRKNILLRFQGRYAQVNGYAKELKSELEKHLKE